MAGSISYQQQQHLPAITKQKSLTETTDDAKADEAVDPRIQVELERLNSATDAINRLEVDLDDARATFRQLLMESTAKIDQLAKKLGTCIEKARPYYESRMKAKEALQEAQKAAVRFERANSAHVAAKEMVALAEEGLKTEGRIFDHAWQEMLNHATMRVNEAERERSTNEEEHRHTSLAYQYAEHKVQELQRELKKSILKSRPYFEMKAHFNQLMEEQKHKVRELEETVSRAKLSYADALRNLEHISDEIHQGRVQEQVEETGLGTRSAGVGAESPILQQKNTEETKHVLIHPLMDEYFELPHHLSKESSPPIQETTKLPKTDDKEFLQLPVVSSAVSNPCPSQKSSSAVGIQGKEPKPNVTKCTPEERPRNHPLTLELPLEDLDISDSESLASVDVLNDEQIACLMLERELKDAYEEVLATPVAEAAPLIPN